MKKIALVVGHNEKAKGAYSRHLRMSEFPFWAAVASLLKDKDIKVFKRQAGASYWRQIDQVYKEVDEWGADASVELHFNSASPSAQGAEVLSSGSSGSLKIARVFQDIFQRHWKHRGVKVRKKRDRGGRSLHAGRCPAILIEPFFGSNAKDCAVLGDDPVGEMASIMDEALAAV